MEKVETTIIFWGCLGRMEKGTRKVWANGTRDNPELVGSKNLLTLLCFQRCGSFSRFLLTILGYSLGGPPPVIVTVADNRDYIRALLYGGGSSQGIPQDRLRNLN